MKGRLALCVAALDTGISTGAIRDESGSYWCRLVRNSAWWDKYSFSEKLSVIAMLLMIKLHCVDSMSFLAYVEERFALPI